MEDFYSLQQTKPRFYPLLRQFLMKVIIDINPVCAKCVRTPAEDDEFQRLSMGGWGVCVSNDFVFINILLLDIFLPLLNSV